MITGMNRSLITLFWQGTILLSLVGSAVSCGPNPNPNPTPNQTPAADPPDRSATASIEGPGESSKPETESESASESLRIFEVQGVVEELLPDGRTVQIRHDEIPGYMKAMSMPFDVKDPDELEGLTPGDRVGFRMLITPDDGWIDRVRVLESAPDSPQTPSAPRSTTRIVRSVDPLETGDTIPDYPFVNQDGESLRLHQFRGQAVAFSFIFTRCPFPDFCPRMISRLKEAEELLKNNQNPDAPDNWHLLAISFDPEFDTPTVLKNYAAQYEIDLANWDFVTGELIEIDAITEQLGLMFARDAETGQTFNHNLRTIVLDTHSRIHHAFVGNQWSAEELAEKIAEAAAVPIEN